ncbi:hypothetical protein E1B28_004188 [Marasmius oreades]|uniref:GATA-type domain-containing protein n=1 Tax=Marasmius oreades TaxID=181124 RepID=A0A9P8ACU0_9AGAR|nr:uncharacterized protein E1B28_004188 [Marasmius oreades]KAG7096778.1 hypothetical protein E1B28_004188 [Marasmius oreades]
MTREGGQGPYGGIGCQHSARADFLENASNIVMTSPSSTRFLNHFESLGHGCGTSKPQCPPYHPDPRLVAFSDIYPFAPSTSQASKSSAHRREVEIVYTDESSTRLSDRVRRKCFNCSGTDTRTWRRSSLTPGKVLCNKCGLYERAHSRHRPAEQKRGMSTSIICLTPPYASPLPAYNTEAAELPPIQPGYGYGHENVLPSIQTWVEQNAYVV